MNRLVTEGRRLIHVGIFFIFFCLVSSPLFAQWAKGYRVYTADEKGGTISVIDPEVGRVIAQIKGLTAPHNVHMGPDGMVYATDGPSNQAAMIDPATQRIVKRWATGKNPAHIFVTPDRKYIMNTNTDSHDVTVVDYTNFAPVATIPVGSKPHGISVTPDSRFAYVPNIGSNDVSVVDLTLLIEISRIPIGHVGVQAFVDPAGQYVYVSSLKSHTVAKIAVETNSIVSVIPVGELPAQIGVSPDGRYLISCDQRSNQISIIDTATDRVIRTLSLGKWTHGVSFSADSRFAYLTNTDSDDVSVVDLISLTEVKRLSVGRGPNGIAASYPVPRAAKAIRIVDPNALAEAAPLLPGGTVAEGEGTEPYGDKTGRISPITGYLLFTVLLVGLGGFLAAPVLKTWALTLRSSSTTMTAPALSESIQEEREGRQEKRMEKKNDKEEKGAPASIASMVKNLEAAHREAGITHNIVQQVNQAFAAVNARMSKIAHKVAIMSGKGGVGKSTVTVNLALAFAKKGMRVGVVDVDLSGPCIPKMFGIRERTVKITPEGALPATAILDIKVMSMDLMLPTEDAPVMYKGLWEDSAVWRGTWEMSIIREILADVVWGELDLLILDMPPASSDKPPVISQMIPDLDGTMIITIPSRVSQMIVRKSITFVNRELKMPLLGIIENMSGFICPECGHETELFSAARDDRRWIHELGVPLLGKIPFDRRISTCADNGSPFVVEYPDSAATGAFLRIAENVSEILKNKGGQR